MSDPNQNASTGAIVGIVLIGLAGLCAWGAIKLAIWAWSVSDINRLGLWIVAAAIVHALCSRRTK